MSYVLRAAIKKKNNKNHLNLMVKGYLKKLTLTSEKYLGQTLNFVAL